MSQATKEQRSSTKQEQEVSASELAKRLKVDPKDLRKWLRSEGKGLGERGKRYSFTPKEATDLARAYRSAQKKAQEAEADAS